jgi:P27 family predicted phage terminase small subunit
MSKRPLPKPPEALPAEMHREWRAVVADLRGRGALDPITLGMAQSFIMAGWTAREAEKVIAREGVFVLGSNGIGKPHPATGLLRSSRETLVRLGFQLGLTPAARARHAAAPPAAKPEAAKWDL